MVDGSNSITNEEVFDAIIKYGLSIRQVPNEVHSLFTMERYNPLEHTIVEQEVTLPNVYKYWKNQDADHCAKHVRFDDDKKIIYRKYACETKAPQYAGYWMCKQVKDTSSRVQWLMRTDNLAPTLNKSVELFLKQLKVITNEKLHSPSIIST